MKLRPLIFHCLVFISASVFFLIFSFPEEQAAARLNTFLSAVQSDGFRLDIQSVRPGIPNRLTSDRAAVLIGKETRIVPDRFDIVLNPFHLFGTEKKVGLVAMFNNGRMEGDLHLVQLNPLKLARSELNLADIRIDRYPYDTELANLTISGFLSGNYMTPGVGPNNPDPDAPDTDSSMENPTGKGSWVLRNASVEIRNALFNQLNLSMIEFPDISCDYNYSSDKKMIIIDKILARGPMINLSLTGRINLETPWNESRLSLQGTLLPDSAHLSGFSRVDLIRSKVRDIKKKGIGFTINGTILHPKINI